MNLEQEGADTAQAGPGQVTLAKLLFSCIKQRKTERQSQESIKQIFSLAVP